jgi:hypothetical protein
MEKKVVYEVRLSKPLMAVAVIGAVGLFAIGVKPMIEATPAFAQSGKVQKIAICNKDGYSCADVGGMLATNYLAVKVSK